MSFKRQLKRNAEKKATKRGRAKTKRALDELAAMPDSCTTCGAKFDIKNDFYLDNWIMKVTDAGIYMYCDTCKAKG